MGKASQSSIRVKVWVAGRSSGRQSNPVAKLLMVGIMGTAVAAAASGIWLATRLILDPGAVSWLHRLIPGWEAQPLTTKVLQTRSEIAAAAAAAGLSVGEPIYFSTYPGLPEHAAGFDQFLLPFYKAPSRPTPANCQSIDSAASASCHLVELRVYRPQTRVLSLSQEAPLELVDRLSVTGPEELAAIAPLVNAEIVEPGSGRRVPLSHVTFIAGNAPLPGIWLHLSGQWQRGSSRVLYGQVVRYDPSRDRLQALLSWTSPTAKFPVWQQVTGGGVMELVVDQTIGLEPQFQVYQFAALNTPGKPVQVKAIDLHPVISDDRAYANGLLLARHGLWSLALPMLEQSKKHQPHWSTLAQAQRDLVALHASVTQAQAQRDWDNPGQQIRVLLMDGRWDKALTVLRTAHASGYPTSNLLTDQSDRLWNRVEAAVRVSPQADVLNWGILLTAVRQDRATALTWLQTQAKLGGYPGYPQAEQILSLLDPLPVTTVAANPPASSTAPARSPVSSAAMVPVSTAASSSRDLPGRIIGTATPHPTIDPAHWSAPWLRSVASERLALVPNQTWYEIQVIGWQEGAQWRTLIPPDAAVDADPQAIAQLLWQRLGLNQNAQLQLIAWTTSAQPQILQTMVQAIRIVDGTVWLLAMGESPAEPASSLPLLALTMPTLPWMEPLSTLTLASLSQQPGWAETLVPALWQELQHAPQLLLAEVTTPTALLQRFGEWSVQLMELTGDDQPEAVLMLQTVPSHNHENSPVPRHAAQTLIFSKQRGLLYSDLSGRGRSLRAMANLGEGTLPALIISHAQGYDIQRWSVQSQQFESISTLLEIADR